MQTSLHDKKLNFALSSLFAPSMLKLWTLIIGLQRLC